MDNNTTNPQVQNTADQPTPGVNPPQNVPPPQPNQDLTAQQIPVQPQQVVENQPSANPVPEGQRITLEDLYGPSEPDELQQTATPQQPAEVSTLLPQETVQTLVQPEATLRRPSDMPPEVVQQNVLPQATLQPEHAKKEEIHTDGKENSSGGFYASGIVKFLIGGFIVLLIIALVWGVSSFFLSGSKSGNGKVTLEYWGLWEDKNVVQPIIDDFQKQHPNITVTYIRQDAKDYTKRLLTRIQDGTGPDIFRLHNTWVYPLKSILLPLPTAVIDTKQLQGNYPSVVATDLVNNGAIYGLPLEMDNLSLFVNTDIFTHAGASVPTTWDNFITVAKALTVKDPNGKIQTAGAALGTYDNVVHAPDIISLLLLQNGANLDKLKGSNNAKDALSFYTSFAQADGGVWDGTLDNSLLAFERGKLAMYFGYSYDILAIQAASPDLKFTVHPVPHLPGRNMTIASYWIEGVSNRSKHQKEALEFMQYLAQKDTQAKLYTEESKTRAFGEPYARNDLAEGLKQNTFLAPFFGQFQTAVSSFFVSNTNYDEYNGALNQYLANAINSILQDTSVDSALETLDQGVAQVRNTFAPATK